MPPRIYFDNAATTPPDPVVLEAMEPYLRQFWGNPASLYVEGRQAREALDGARGRVAALLGAEPGEIVFTSGGTEADNLALQGVLMAAGPAASHLVTSAIEHPAVLACCQQLERLGVAVTRLRVDDQGLVDPADLEAALQPNTRLVSVMTANNVTGALQPIKELAEITRRHGALFHTDAVQAVGKLDLDLRTLPVDLLALSGHKIHGPKGVGALYVRKGVELWPLLPGGGQEQGRRSGTENVAGIVGLGRAAELAAAEGSAEVARLVRIREHLIEGILASIPRAYLIGHRWRRLPGHICMGLHGLEGQAIKLLLELDTEGIAISSGSACSAIHAGQPSHVLEAMGLDPLRARGSLRITLGRFNTMEEADRLLEVFPRAVAALGNGLGTRDWGLEGSPLTASAG
ncbi:MAG: cysteine desulfurase family protein [Thermoguttaceae bacterium]